MDGILVNFVNSNLIQPTLVPVGHTLGVCSVKSVDKHPDLPYLIKLFTIIIDIYKAQYPLLAQSALQYSNMVKTIKKNTQ